MAASQLLIIAFGNYMSAGGGGGFSCVGHEVAPEGRRGVGAPLEINQMYTCNPISRVYHAAEAQLTSVELIAAWWRRDHSTGCAGPMRRLSIFALSCRPFSDTSFLRARRPNPETTEPSAKKRLLNKP